MDLDEAERQYIEEAKAAYDGQPRYVIRYPGRVSLRSGVEPDLTNALHYWRIEPGQCERINLQSTH